MTIYTIVWIHLQMNEFCQYNTFNAWCSVKCCWKIIWFVWRLTSAILLLLCFDSLSEFYSRDINNLMKSHFYIFCSEWHNIIQEFLIIIERYMIRRFVAEYIFFFASTILRRHIFCCCVTLCGNSETFSSDSYILKSVRSKHMRTCSFHQFLSTKLPWVQITANIERASSYFYKKTINISFMNQQRIFDFVLRDIIAFVSN